MTEILGTWKSNTSTTENYDAWAKQSGELMCNAWGKQSGYTDDLIESCRNAITTEIWSKDGDTWSQNVKCDVYPEKTYTFQLGKEITEYDPFGGQVKYTVTLNPDGKMTEVLKTEINGWKETKTYREVKGDKLIVIQEVDGVQMKLAMDRIE